MEEELYLFSLNLPGKIMKFLFILFFLSWLFVPIEITIAKETTLSDTLARVKPSIVAIGTYLPSRLPREVLLGTGFAVDDGQFIITNAHVTAINLDKAHLEEYAVFYRQEKKEYMLLAELIAMDEEHDLALLSLKDGHLPPLAIGDSNSVKEGQAFAFTGYPIGQILGLFPVTHRSIISAISPNVIPAKATQQLGVNMIKRLQAPYDVFQLDANAFPGNSGSPLYDEITGKVIGIINKVFVQGSKENAISTPSGITYAVPSEYIKSFIAEKKVKP